MRIKVTGKLQLEGEEVYIEIEGEHIPYTKSPADEYVKVRKTILEKEKED